MELNKSQIEANKILGMQGKTDILLYSGSRAGKTFLIVRALILRALKAEVTRHLLLRQTYSEANFSLINQTIPSVFKYCFPKLRYELNKSEHIFKIPNGSELWVAGIDTGLQVEKILGTEYSSIYFGEISQMLYESVNIIKTRLAERSALVNRCYYDCNPPTKKHWGYKVFILGEDPRTGAKISNIDAYAYYRLEVTDNKENLADNYITNVLNNLSEKLKKRFLIGEFADEVEGALWNDDMINKYRVKDHPPLTRVVVSIDPSITATANSDECGIIVAGKGVDGHYYILSDYSGIYTPAQWGKVAVAAYYEHKATAIIAETNQGGDLVKSNIFNIDNHIRTIGVHATKGKLLRAEPVQGLYENGLVHHVGVLDKLEYEMTTYDGKSSADSPNRLDAMVYAVTELTEKFNQITSTKKLYI